MAGRDYRDLLVWQRSLDFVKAVYKVSAKWPNEEQYGLTSQVRRASVAVPSIIAEGQGRRTPGDFLRFFNIANGSLREAETQIMIAGRLSVIDEMTLERLPEDTAEIGRLLHGLI